MKKSFFPRLAASNIKKNGRTYIPFILTCILTTAMFYIVKSLSLNPGMEKLYGGNAVVSTMAMGSWIVGLFAFIFLFYTNSFLVKQRKKEFGVFNILGMEKLHLSIVLGWETLFTALLSLAAGLVVGIALDKLMFLLVSRVLGAEIVLGFFISPKAVCTTLALFAVIFALILVNAICQIKVSNPVELLRAGNAGEKEPKTKWLLTVFGAACVGSGYYLAITTEDPVASIGIFFVAVILVIVGTYSLFTAGSIALLKMLRKNKKFYYTTKHFTSIAGMIYRMKQNAAGLANICILSTMVLVMLSSTSSMLIGMNDIIRTRYPYDFVLYSYETDQQKWQEGLKMVKHLQKESGLSVEYEAAYTYLDFWVLRRENGFTLDMSMNLTDINKMNVLFFITLSDYNQVSGENRTLNDGEILLYSNRDSYDEPVLELFDKTYRVAEKLDHFFGNGIAAADIASTQFIVVPDMEELKEIYEKQKELRKEKASDIDQVYQFDSSAGEDEQKAFYHKTYKQIAEAGFQIRLESREAARLDFAGLYGGFFFIGVFLSVLFVMATVLIIYYKQISEGYDDKERFAIMQKVGMSHLEVRASIRSQVLTVFFLPLAVAGIHVTAAFPLISRILALLSFSNNQLYIFTSIGVFLVFAVMYVLIYMLTARSYYKIVKR